MSEEKRKKTKVVLLGDASVGKTSLVTRFVNNRFNETIEATVGAAFSTRALTLDTAPPKTVKFEIWDTAGQERFRSLAPMYYRGAAGAIVVCDVTAPITFSKAQDWISELRTSVNAQDCVIALACNKSDKPSQMNTLQAKEYARSEGLIYMETSAVTGEGVQQIFHALGEKLIEKDEERIKRAPLEDEIAQISDGITLKAQPTEPKQTTCCGSS